ncbi:MAG: heparinase II/III family protein [Dongiaceae bacterium]
MRSLIGLPRDMLRQRIWYGVRRPLFGSGLYGLTLPTRVPAGPSPAPLSDSWPGNAAQGSAIIQGMFTFAGQTIREPAPLWSPVGATRPWLAELHGFEWLRDLRAVGGEGGRRAGRQLIERWIDDNSRWDAVSWSPELIGRRLAAWLSHFEFLGVGSDALFRGRYLLSAARQAAHLARVLPAGLGGSELLTAIIGLIQAGLVLPRGGNWNLLGRRLLEHHLPRQLRADGGHCERSPTIHLALLRRLTDLRAAIGATGQAEPDNLDNAIAGLAQMIRLFQHGDGRLALFNDSNEEEDWLIDMALGRADGKGLAMKQAPDSGFQRLAAGRTVAIVDAGLPALPGADEHVHAGTLSFEMSVGKERLVVNCGAHPGGEDWWRAQRSTAAHSTLVVDDTNSMAFADDGGVVRGPHEVTCRRQDSDGNTWLEMSHDGYREVYDLVHQRRLYLSAGGDDLRGEDRLEGAGRRPFAIRFHLHPEVNAETSHDGQAAILRLASGAGWRLRATGGPVTLNESIYLGQRGEQRRSQQAVITGETAGEGATIKWAITREARTRA